MSDPTQPKTMRISDNTSRNLLLAAIVALIIFIGLSGFFILWQSVTVFVKQKNVIEDVGSIDVLSDKNSKAIVDIYRIIEERTKE